jgi:hypothetical protein
MWFSRHRRVDGGHRRGLRLLAAVLVGAAAVVAVVVVSSVSLSNSVSNIGKREHLKPIPVAARAGPFVAAMHEAANDLQVALPIFGVALDAHGRALTWPQARARLGRAADALEFSIAAGLTQFPPRVQHYLETVRRELRAGRAQLRAARDASDFSVRTGALWRDGQDAFGFAGDLVGRQCGVQLGADSDDNAADPKPDTVP